MSVMLSGPRRVYVLLLFWQPVGRDVEDSRPLPPIERAMSVSHRRAPAHDHALCRPVVAVRLRRVLWSRLVGFSLLVFDARA